jgi:hypothetical protein
LIPGVSVIGRGATSSAVPDRACGVVGPGGHFCLAGFITEPYADLVDYIIKANNFVPGVNYLSPASQSEENYLSRPPAPPPSAAQ